jgi:hypothetical protein
MAELNSISKIESLSELEGKVGGEYERWLSELTAAEKELKKWRTKARKIVKEYRAESMEVSGVDPSMERRFNLFAANVNILSTSLLNQVPKPDVNREFNDMQDDVARVACNILERALEAHNSRGFKSFNILKQVVQDLLVPGAGTSWHTYYADIERRTEEPTEEMLAVNPQAEAMEYEEVVGEQVKDEYVYWEDLLWSPARCWEEVRWIARKTYMTKDQLSARFGKALAKKIPLDHSNKKDDVQVKTKNEVFQQAVIYEIWDHEAEQVHWLSKHYEKVLDTKDDFLELDDFYPCPKILFSAISNGQLVPIPDYHYAKDQYRELNEINTRMGLLVRACRVAGVYDKNSPAIPQLLNNAAENTLVPVDQWAMFAEKGGIKGVIDWIPLEQIVAALDQLMKNREDVKQQIYEITGMADIIRGASKASETLGAQKLKAQYASMRIQERQKNVVEYTSSVFDIQAQLMRKHMSEEEISKLAQVQFMNEDPQLVQQAMQLLKMPEFTLRARVESDSLSDIDFQAEKQDRMEYMTTITNYLKEMAPIIQGDPLLGPFVMQLLQFSLAGFKVGKKFEGQLDKTFAQIQQKLANPPPPQPTPEQQKIQGEMQMAKEEHQLTMQEKQADMGAKQQEIGMRQQEGQMELQLKREEMGMKREEMQMDREAKVMDIGMKRQEQQLNMQGKQQAAQVDAEINQQRVGQSQAEFWQKFRQQEQTGKQKIQQQKAQAAAKPKPKPAGGKSAKA